MKFLPYQKRWILDDSPLKLYEKTRRGGITYATSYRAVIKCLKRGDGFTQWVASRDEITAKEFITDYVAKWAKLANTSVRGLDGTYAEIVDEKHGVSARTVKFRNGARIVSLSSNPLAFAGKGGDVLVDEWDLHPDQAAVYDMAYPCITWGGQLELVSAYSASGSDQTEFARLCNACRNGERRDISFHRTTILDAVEEGFVETVNEVKAARGMPPLSRQAFLAQLEQGCRSKSAFESQYLCIPNRTGGEQLIPPDDLRNAIADEYKTLRLHCENGDDVPADWLDPLFWQDHLPDEHYVFGYDIARTGDLSAVWLSFVREKILYPAAIITLKNCPFGIQKKLIRAILDSTYNINGCADKTGMGMAVCEELQESYPERFCGLNFAADKFSLAIGLKNAFEQRQIRLPADLPEIQADLAGIRKSAAISGKLCFTESKNELLPSSHCDIAWSCALAVRAANEQIPSEDAAFTDELENKFTFERSYSR